MKVSIIIVNYNGKELLKKILASLKSSKFKDYEIIVLDNASTDDSKGFLRKNYPRITVVANKSNLGYSGINNAIKHCKGKYILFLNNDMEIDKNCIGNLVKTLESDDSIGMTVPKLVNYYNKNLVSGGTWLSRAFYNGHIKEEDKPKNRIVPYLGVGLIRKTIVDTYGCIFDPDYFIYGEDVDLGLRIRLLGKKIIFVSDAVSYHMHGLTALNGFKSSKMTYLMERNLLISFFKNIPLSRVFLYLPYVLLFRVVAMAKDIVSLNFTGFFSRIKALLWVIVHFHKILLKRRDTQKHKKASTKFILEIFSEKNLYKKKFIV
ncbi:hypothetical protein CMO94_00200 [Candidatus Woesearchaeota archaeon]|jgi:GT2 family glycosyltransferase|nr:hypothetical protein [Candidatus Woesearchaeota archaeon]